ncbi:PucR family transcriptional regulator [Biomaibacter acetigenes]|uniref:PucR family transcriptional regulator n=1 Tax=Biomaibacter acetigenes TaxID=2316383 RepID=A0A3G2R783_9FIRM|nr:PucR family transcriptional regulator [Biomaibacter acetigenes]AYO31269.1 PucR family transcriptional regulator [Biomaibacter acetigenes]MDN5300978.1 PucR family transcriptional regulator, purine catabolism regulatory protein [Thermoanaerobacteraceae bacterium]
MMVSDILDLPEFKEVKILAGNQNVTNRIKWVNILEILDELSRLHEGEFLITTAYGFDFHNINNTYDLVNYLSNKRIAALALQVGFYVDKIPDKFIKVCNEKGLPLLCLPPSVSFSEITRTLSKRLFEEEERQRTRARMADELVEQILSDSPPGQELIRQKYHELSFDWSTPFVVSMLHVENDKINSQRLRGNLEFYLNQQNLKYILSITHGELLIFISLGCCGDKLSQVFSLITDNLKRYIENTRFYFGIGEAVNSISEAKLSLMQAQKVVDFFKRGFSPDKNFMTYHDLGIFKLLIEIPEKVLTSFYDEILGELCAYDNRHSAELLKTLDIYLENGNITHTAENLFTHRHTIRYRLAKIKELTGLDVENGKDRMTLYMANLIKKLLP